MNTRIQPLALAIATLLPVCAAAQTASNVQIYGRIDLSVNHQRSGSTATAPSRSQSFVSSDSTLIGFRGVEDLGGGLRAYFKMEHGLNSDTGAAFSAATFWNRETYVGLGSNTYGSLQLGSQYTPSLLMTARLDPFRRSNLGAIMSLFQQGLGGIYGYPSQHANAVQYISPNLGGLTARALWATREGAAPGGNPVGLSAEFAKDRLFVGASYDRINTAGAAAGQPALAAVRNTTYALGATYQFVPVKLHGYYIHTKVDGAATMKGVMLGASVPVGSGEVAASFQRRDLNDAANSDAQLVALQYTHFLSKRTWAYVGAAHQTNKGAAAFGIWPSRMEAGAAGLPAAGANASAVQVGVRHTF